jgi:tetratricopeptide (TPR) repeat protein
MREEELQESWELLAGFRHMGGWPRSSRNALVMAVRLAIRLGKADANSLLVNIDIGSALSKLFYLIVHPQTIATCYAYTSPTDPHRAKLLVHLWLEIRNPKLAMEIKSAGLLSITEIPDAKCNAGCLVALAVLFHIKGNYEEAANCFESAVHIMPGNPVLLEFSGRSLRTVGALVKSLGAYRCALRLEPESCSARYGIACIHWDMGFRELSVRWLVDAIRLRGNSFWRSDDQICQMLSGCFERMVSSHF